MFGLWDKKHADFADDADFFVGDLCFFVPQISQICTDFGLVRSLDKKHADFADDADFFVGDLCFFVPQISQIYADFFVWIFGEFSFRLWQERICVNLWNLWDF